MLLTLVCSKLASAPHLFSHIDNGGFFFRKRFGDIYLVNSNTLCKVLVTKSYCSLYRHGCGIRMQFFFRYFVHTYTFKAIYDVLYDLCRFATKILTESNKFLFNWAESFVLFCCSVTVIFFHWFFSLLGQLRLFEQLLTSLGQGMTAW